MRVTLVRPQPLAALVRTRTGADLAPLLPALCLVAMAGAGALVATRGAVRVALGVLLAGCGVGIVVCAVGFRTKGDHLSSAAAGFAGLCCCAGVVITTVGLLAVRNRASWPSLGARFERRGRAMEPGRGVASGTSTVGSGLGAVGGGVEDPEGGAFGASSGEDASSAAVSAARPATVRPVIGTALWDALDRGEDPTADDPTTPDDRQPDVEDPTGSGQG